MGRGWRAVCVGGSLALVGILFLLTMRWSLTLLLLVSTLLLLWTWVKNPARLVRRSAAVCVLAMIVAGAPADVRLGHSDRPSVVVKPILWGLPTRETMEQIEPGSVIWGGCIMPVNPARYAVLVSW